MYSHKIKIIDISYAERQDDDRKAGHVAADDDNRPGHTGQDGDDGDGKN